MKMVDMRLKMDIILLVKFYQQSDWSSSTSVSTYLQQDLRVPITQASLCEVEKFSHGAHSYPSPLTESLLCHNAHWPHAINMDNYWPRTFRGKATLSNLHPPDLYIIMVLSLNMCGSSGSTFFFQKMHPRQLQYKFAVGNKICEWKRPTSQKAWILKTRNKWGIKRKEKPFTWEGAFCLGENSTVL